MANQIQRMLLSALIVTAMVAMAGSVAAEDGWISGYISDTYLSPLGDPIPGATVSAVGGMQTATANATGYYNLTLPEGNYTLRISAPGFTEKTSSQLEVSGNDTTHQSFVLVKPKGNLTGTVTDEDNKPIQYVSVTPHGYIFGTMTDASGKYTLNGIDAGPINLTVTALGYNEFNVSATVVAGQTTPRDIKLGAQISYVIVTVANSDDMPIPNATVKIGSVSGVTDSAGQVTLNVSAGTHTLSVSASGYRKISQSITVAKGSIEQYTGTLLKSGAGDGGSGTSGGLPGGTVMILLLVIIIIVVVVVVIAVVMKGKKDKPAEATAPPAQAPPAPGQPPKS